MQIIIRKIGNFFSLQISIFWMHQCEIVIKEKRPVQILSDEKKEKKTL